MNPLVSICIPAYEQPALLARALESVFSQGYCDFEVIVTDDSKSDAVENLISRWCEDDRLRYFRNPIRLGSPKNWNYAMSLAQGKYIKFLHHDDWFMHPRVLSTFVNAMQSQPNVQFAFSACRNVNAEGEASVHTIREAQIVALKASPLLLHYGNLIGDPSTTIFCKKNGFVFDEKIKWVVDVEAYIRLLKDDNFYYISEPLVGISSGGEHQVTREFEIDHASRIAEHLYMYERHPFKRWSDRLNFSKWIRRCFISGLSRNEWKLLKQRRHGKRRSCEERIAFLMNDFWRFARAFFRKGH